jgi:hypothetical protein
MLSCLIKNPNWELDDIQFWEKSIQEKKNTVCDDQKKSIFEDDKKKSGQISISFNSEVSPSVARLGDSVVRNCILNTADCVVIGASECLLSAHHGPCLWSGGCH